MSRDPEERSLPVATGVSLHALTWLTGSGTPFLLLHGLSSNARTWERAANVLHDHGHPVAALDLRGHGRSDKPDDGYDFGTFVADAQAAMDGLGFDRAVVAGQSTGGNLTVELAHRSPERLVAAAGVDGGALELQRRFPGWEECEQTLAPPRFDGVASDALADRIRSAHPDWDDWAMGATLGNLEVREDGTIRPRLTRERHLRLLRSLWEHRPSQVLPVLTVPLLLVNADNDDDWAETRKHEAADAESAGPHVRVEWLAGGHDLHLERPDEIARLLLALAAESGSGPP